MRHSGGVQQHMVQGLGVRHAVALNEIAVRILGPLEIARRGVPVALGGRRERTLLALLVARAGRVVPTEQVIDELWEGSPPPSALTSLRAHVSRARKSLAQAGVDQLLVTQAAGYALATDEVVLDVAVFEERAAAGRARLAAGDPVGASACLREALTLWRGTPFGDLATCEFARPEVVRLEEERRRVLEDRIDADLLAGRHRELTGELEALVSEDPLRERLWGQRMLALYRSGRQADALRAYTELRGLLGDALGIMPSPSLQQLEVAILCQDPVLELPAGIRDRPAAPLAPTDADVPRPPAGRLPIGTPPVPAELRAGACEGGFVGRVGEVGRLERLWQEVLEGGARCALVAGEPGIGKTTLAGEVALRAHESGAAILLGRCDRQSLTPYQPFVEALRRFVQTCDPTLLGHLAAPDLREVARLVPELAGRLEGMASAEMADDDDRYDLFEGVASFLHAAAAAHPVVLVLDDLHWADAPTCLLLRHLVRRSTGAPLMILGTYRDVDVTASHPLTEVLADLRREPATERLLLRGLAVSEVGSLVAGIVDEDAPSTEVAGALCRETGGNPFFVREMVRHLRGVAGSPATWGEGLLRHGPGVPESVREVIGRRVSTLSAAAASVLSVASVMGLRFDVETLEAVGVPGVAVDAVLDAVDEVAASGLATELPDAPGWYGFSHALVRDVLYSELSTVRRLRLHGAIGEALEGRTGPHAPAPALLAHHFLEAGPAGRAPDRAVEHCIRASEAAMEQLAYEEAASYLERALEVQADLDGVVPVQRLDLLLDLGQAQWLSGSASTGATFTRAAEEAWAAGDTVRYARAVVGLGLDAGGFASSIHANQDLIEHSERALAGLGPGDGELRVRLLSRLAIERYFTAQRAQGEAEALDALATAERLGVPRIRLGALHALAWARFAPDTPPADRLDMVADMSVLAEAAGDREMAYRGEVLRLQTLLEVGDVDGAAATVARIERLVGELRMPRFSPWVRSYEATVAFLRGDVAEADRLAESALAEAVLLGTDLDAALALISGQQMAVRIYRDGLGPFAEALQAMAEALSDQPAVLAMLPVLHRELDQREEAVASYAQAVVRRDEVPRDATWLIYAWALGVSCRVAGATATAEPLYSELLPYADRWAVSTPSICFGPMGLALAGYASVLGWHDAALAHVESSLASARATRTPIFEAATLVEEAEVRLLRAAPGDVDLAVAALDRAAAIGAPLGLASLLARAERLRATT